MNCAGIWRRCRSPSSMLALVLLIALAILNCFSAGLVEAILATDESNDYLDEDSIILITGAAGFIGSELALALFRTYSPKRILCIDRMGDNPSTQEELALFEFQRQRAFHVMQTLGKNGRFYRVDFRPMIPEYFDLGEVPVLDHIFRENPGITHIVHLADPFPHSTLQVVPREKDVPKAGMIEALLEQMLKVQREGGRVPHLTYASSYEVYPYSTNTTITLLEETQSLTVPSSLRGASKLIDETLSKLYFDQHGIYSVGLRFFPVFGPWSVPGSTLFEMGERAVNGQLPAWDPHWKSVRDYVYIDDAVDGILAAMQFRPVGEKPHPIVVNIASGHGTSLEKISKLMRSYFPAKGKDSFVGKTSEEASKTVAVGSIERAKQLLGYEPQYTLEEGIVKLLAWHYDRAYPYGDTEKEENDKAASVAKQGIVSCSPFDAECLKAAPVFPCASECSHSTQCTNSFFDEIAGWTQVLTENCQEVLYTVAFDKSLDSIPSAHLKIKSTSESFLSGTCNLAFVSEQSVLVQTLRNENPLPSLLGNGRQRLLTTGKWILIPIVMPTFSSRDENVLYLLPKLSPGLFFGPKVKRAIYIDPNILLDSIPKLLREASMQPQHHEVEGATAMLIGKGKSHDFFAQDLDDFVPKQQIFPSTNSVIQNAAYRMIRIAVSEKLFGGGLTDILDSRWMVHTLQSDDSRLFRCDVFGEVVQWEVDTDRSALEFVLGLHDMWSRVIAEKPWWTDENVVTIPEGATMRRRLQEADDTDDDTVAEDTNADGSANDENDNTDDEDTELTANDGKGDKDEEVENEENSGKEDDNDQGENEGAQEEDEGAQEEDEDAEEEDEGAQEEDDDSVPDNENPLEQIKDEEDDHGGFGTTGEKVEEIAAEDKDRGSEEDEDIDQLDMRESPGDSMTKEGDFSAYDTWMGVLSATSKKYFVRIVPSSEVGVVSLEDFNSGFT